MNLLIPDLCFGLHFEAVLVNPFNILFWLSLDETDLEDVFQVQLQTKIVSQTKLELSQSLKSKLHHCYNRYSLDIESL